MRCKACTTGRRASRHLRCAARSTVRRVIRRSFRMGLTLGVLAGLVVALVKLMQSRQTPLPASPTRPWTPLDDGPAATPAAAPVAARVAAPSEPKPEPVVVAVDTIVEPLDDEAAEPLE